MQLQKCSDAYFTIFCFLIFSQICMLIIHQMIIDSYASLFILHSVGSGLRLYDDTDLNRSLEYLFLMLCLCSGPQLMLFIVLTVSD